MKATIKNTQCPNCWGYQEYDEQFPEREICTCKIENNN